MPSDLGAAALRFPAVGALTLAELPHQGLGERQVRVVLDHRDQVANDTSQSSRQKLSLLRLFALSDHLAELPKTAMQEGDSSEQASPKLFFVPGPIEGLELRHPVVDGSHVPVLRGRTVFGIFGLGQGNEVPRHPEGWSRVAGSFVG